MPDSRAPSNTLVSNLAEVVAEPGTNVANPGMGVGNSNGIPVHDDRFDTVVVGAGIAGLTIAHRLHRANRNVLLLEASDHVGGAIRTHRENGYLVECGPNTVLDTHPEVQELIDELSLSDERIIASRTAKKRFIVRGGRPVEMPTSPLGLIRTNLFSLRAKLRIAAEPLIRRADPSIEETVADFVTRRLGQEFLDYAIDPFVSGVYAGRPQALSVREAFPRLVEIEQKYGSLIVGQIRGARERKARAEKAKTAAEMFSFQNGLDRLPRAIATELGHRVQKKCTATSIIRDDDGWTTGYSDGNGDERRVRSGSVVYCAGLQKTDLLDSLGADTDPFRNVYYPPLCVIALGYRKEQVAHPLDGFGLLVPSVEKRHILGALFVSSLFELRAPEGHVLITAFVGGSRQPSLTLSDDTTVLNTAEEDLRELLHIRGEHVFSHLTRWTASIPQYHPGYGKVKAALSQLEQSNPGLFFAGNYRSGISVPDTIHSSCQIAESIGEYVTASTPTLR